MAGTLIASGSAAYLDQAAASFIIDADAEAGDVILVDYQTSRSQDDSATPSGGNGEWLQYNEATLAVGASQKIFQFAYTVDGSDTPGTTELTVTASYQYMQTTLAWEVWRGLDGSDLAGGSLINATDHYDQTESGGYTFTPVAPTITTTDDDLTVRATWGRGGSALTPDEGTVVINQQSVNGNRRMVTQYMTQASAGATGETQATSGSQDYAQAFRVAYNNDTTPPPSTVRSVFPSPTTRRLRRRSGSR